jgi:hypothetical protein
MELTMKHYITIEGPSAAFFTHLTEFDKVLTTDDTIVLSYDPTTHIATFINKNECGDGQVTVHEAEPLPEALRPLYIMHKTAGGLHRVIFPDPITFAEAIKLAHVVELCSDVAGFAGGLGARAWEGRRKTVLARS